MAVRKPDVPKRTKSPPLHVPLTLEQLAEGLLKTPPKKPAPKKTPAPLSKATAKKPGKLPAAGKKAARKKTP